MFAITYTDDETAFFNLALELLEPDDLAYVTELEGRPVPAPHVITLLSQRGAETLIANFGEDDTAEFIRWLNHDLINALNVVALRIR